MEALFAAPAGGSNRRANLVSAGGERGTPRARCTPDPSLRLKNGCAQDDAVQEEFVTKTSNLATGRV